MKSAVLFIGQFPPPVSGFTFATERLAGVLSATCRLEIVDTSGAGKNGLAFHYVRAKRNLLAAARIVRHRRSHGIVYVACDGGLGIAYALLLAAAAKLSGQRFYLHHHSYAAIDAWNVLMATLLAICGARATHIVLASEMGQALVDRYRRPLSILALPNIALLLPASENRPKAESGDFLTVGLLSNLCLEKGLETFLEIFRQARREGFPLRGILAGPAAGEPDRTLIAKAVAEFGGALEYRGAIYNDAKRTFYADIDVFLFPTRYANEAQPLVIFEALQSGRPVIVADRGCIRNQVADGGIVIPKNADMVEVGVRTLANYLRCPETLRADSRAAKASCARQRQAGARVLSALFDTPPDVLHPLVVKGHSSHD